MDSVLQGFQKQWDFARGLTFDFIEGVDEEHWLFTPNTFSSPLAEQFRHVAQVAGVYNDGLKTGALDWSRKGAAYSGELEKSSIIAALQSHDFDLITVLEEFGPDEIHSRKVDLTTIV